MRKTTLSVLFTLLIVTAVCSAVSVDLSTHPWKPWPVSAYKYRPALSSRTMQADAPAYTLTGMFRWNGGRMCLVNGYNSRPMPVIADIVDENDQYWLLNPRRYVGCGNPLTGIRFKVYRPKYEARKPATTSTTNNNTVTNNYYSYTTVVETSQPGIGFGEAGTFLQAPSGIDEKVTNYVDLAAYPQQNTTVDVDVRCFPPNSPNCPVIGPGPGGGPYLPPPGPCVP